MPHMRRAVSRHGASARQDISASIVRLVSVGLVVVVALGALTLAEVPRAMSAEGPSGSSNRDAEICRALETAIGQLQAAKHHRIASIVMEKTYEDVKPPRYESGWTARIQFYLDYLRAEEDPYLQGMLRCRSEAERQAPKAWLDWASSEIEKRRNLVLNQIAFRQEEKVDLLVKALLDAGGNLAAESLTVSFTTPAGPVPAAEYVRGQPTDDELEAAGDAYLRKTRDQPQSGSAAGQVQGSQTTAGTSAPVQETRSSIEAPNHAAIAPARGNANLTVMAAGMVALLVLAVLMALNQHFLYKKPRR